MWKNFKEQAKDALKELKCKETRKKQIPNLLTASRLLSPFILIPTALSGNVLLTGIFAGAFGLTDLLDGFIARKTNSYSEFGKNLDAITDKLFAGSLLIPLLILSPGNIPFLFTSILLEGLISVTNTYSKLMGYNPKSSYIGKIKTAILFSSIAAGYLSVGNVISKELFRGMLTSTLIAQIATEGCYATDLTKKFKDSEENNQIDNKDITESIKTNSFDKDKNKLQDRCELKEQTESIEEEKPLTRMRKR